VNVLAIVLREPPGPRYTWRSPARRAQLVFGALLSLGLAL